MAGKNSDRQPQAWFASIYGFLCLSNRERISID